MEETTKHTNSLVIEYLISIYGQQEPTYKAHFPVGPKVLFDNCGRKPYLAGFSCAFLNSAALAR